jgi:elongation factor Ts
MSIKITTELVKELRDQTGVSVMQCKNALEEAEGNMEKALIILKNKSKGIAVKKAERQIKDGTIVILEEENRALLLILGAETDFVSKHEDFISLANQLAQLALKEGLEKMNKDSSDLINPVIQKFGEKIEIGKVIEIKGETLGTYVHGNKNGVIVSLEGSDQKLARDLAMHIAAMKPIYLTSQDITQEEKDKVKEVFIKELSESDKPEEIKNKILEGKLDSYFKEQTLVDQFFIKNPDLTIKNLLDNVQAKVISFVNEFI